VANEITLFRSEMSEGLHHLTVGLSLFINATVFVGKGEKRGIV